MTVADPPRTASTTRVPQEVPSPASKGDRAVTVVSHVVLTLWSIIVILPLVWVFLSSWKTTGEIFQSPLALPQHWSFDNYVGAWTDSHIGRYMLNSVIVVTSALVLVMALGSAAAYSLSRYPFPGSGVVYYFILAGLTFPIFLAIVPLFFVLRNVGLLNTLPGLVVTYVETRSPLAEHFMEACAELHLPQCEDPNGAIQLGYGYHQMTADRHGRCSSHRAFTEPLVASAPNLTARVIAAR